MDIVGDRKFVEVPGGTVLTGGMGGGEAGWSPGAALEEPVSAGLVVGWLVHGFLSTAEGFFSSGLGIGGGSGGVAEGCTMGASGISASWGGWVCDGCAC